MGKHGECTTNDLGLDEGVADAKKQPAPWKIKVQAAFLALCFALCDFRFVFFAFGHAFQRYQRGAFV